MNFGWKFAVFALNLMVPRKGKIINSSFFGAVKYICFETKFLLVIQLQMEQCVVRANEITAR